MDKTSSRTTQLGLYKLGATGSQWQRTLGVLRFLLLDAGLLKDPLLAYAMLSSVGRAGLIFSINETARSQASSSAPIIMLVLSAAATILFSHLTRIRNHMMVRRLQHDMRLALGRGVLSADLKFLLRRDKGHVYSALTHEVAEVSGVAINLIQALQAIFLLAICIPYLFWISLFTGLTTLAAVGIGVVGYVIADIPARVLVARANAATAQFFNRVNDMLAGWMELRLFARRRRDFETDVERIVAEVKSHDIRAERYFSISQGFSEAALILLIGANVVFLPWIQGGDTSAMFQVLTVILLTFGPIEQIFAALPRLSRAVSAQQRISNVVHALLREKRGVPAARQGVKRPAFASIEFRNVCVNIADDAVAESGDSFHFGPVSFVLKAGEIVFITGGNGTGKTTLLTLLCGLRYPDSGQILVDGKPVGPQDIADFRALFSAVLGQFHLFEKIYGFDGENLAALKKNIEALHLTDCATIRDGAFSSLALSTGQRRRLALAVALSELSPVIVLDEFTADQDPANRAYFYATLIPEMAKRHDLVVAVTHDEPNFEKCTHLLKMDAGRIIRDDLILAKRPDGPPLQQRESERG